MKKIGFIPLRAGSKGISNKNKKKILGRPLFTWVLSEAIFSTLDKVYIFSDDQYILDYCMANYTWTEKVEVIKRGEHNANDTASTEAAMLEFSEIINHDYDIILLLQATSPLTDRDSINKTLGLVENGKFDSSLSVVQTKRFFWDKEGKSLNYNFLNRPRRQEFEGTLVENGAVYSCRKKVFFEYKNRLGGKIGLHIMPEETYMEIDEPHDFEIVELLLRNRLKRAKESTKQIKALILDVDGVFTKGDVTYSVDGEFSKTFNMRDGMGLEVLKESGVKIIILTAENSKIVASRMKKLGIESVYLGVKDKYAHLENIFENENFSRSECVYVGDDINDLANICSVGWGICPNDAVEGIKRNADIVLNHKGGEMAIREAIEFILKYNNRF